MVVTPEAYEADIRSLLRAFETDSGRSVAGLSPHCRGPFCEGRGRGELQKMLGEAYRRLPFYRKPDGAVCGRSRGVA